MKRILETQVQLATQARARKLDPHSSIETKLTYTSKAKIAAILNIPRLEEYLPQDLSHPEILSFWQQTLPNKLLMADL